MKYKSIELTNYAGIYNGLGLNQITIDFTKCITNKVIIKGKNGSGKSTLLNAINPNPDSNDNFIPNMEARKTIILSNNGIDYLIRYVHPVTNTGNRSTTKGYISKNINGQMVELNPNGNVSSCKDILYEEFNLDSMFLSLSKLTSENRGLVEFRPAERKRLLNSIMSNLDVYNDIYKNLSKKSTTYKSLINSLTYKIDYIGSDIKLNAELTNIKSRLSKLEEEKNSTIEAIAAVKIKISEYANILRDNNYNELSSSIKDNNNVLNNLIKNIESNLDKLQIPDLNEDNIESYIDKIKMDLIELENEKSNLKATIPILLNNRENEFKELQLKQEKLNSLQSDYNYIDIKNIIKASKEIVDKYAKVFSDMKLNNIDLITKSEFDTAMDSLAYLKSLATNLTSSYTIEDLKAVILHMNEVLEKIRKISNLKEQLANTKSMINSLNIEYTEYVSKRELASELINRPKNCTIDSCPYIKAALKANNDYPESKMDNIYRDINIYTSMAKDLENKINKYELYNEIYSLVKNIERELSSKISFINKLPLRKDFKETFLSRVINFDTFLDIDEIYQFIDCGNMIEEYKNAKSELSKYEVEYKLYESKNIIIESIIVDIESLNNKMNEINDSLENTNIKISDISKKIEILNSKKDKLMSLYDKIFNQYNPLKEQQKELLSNKSSLDNYTVELNELQNSLSELNSNLTMNGNDINVLLERKESIKHSLALLVDYKNELHDYSDKYSKIEKIRYYSSSSTGIQILYMKLYMNKILSTANELLSLLFESEFMLQPFIINEQEFRIPCLGSGLLHDDISSMSTAQKSMISMILSFSILHQSETKYNILCLDEIDGALDSSNRSYFMTLLDSLMNILQCEQCFIISHNSEISTEIADLIILKENIGDNLSGNIIWKY